MILWAQVPEATGAIDRLLSEGGVLGAMLVLAVISLWFLLKHILKSHAAELDKVLADSAASRQEHALDRATFLAETKAHREQNDRQMDKYSLAVNELNAQLVQILRELRKP